MVGKDELANAVLGGTSDYISDLVVGFTTKLNAASDDEKVIILIFRWI